MNTMHDWRHRVRKHLEACDLPSATRDDVITELAAHLEETYADARSQGLTEAAAIDMTMQEVKSWAVLSKKIRRAKSKEGSMNARTKNLWLPALASLLGASLAMTLLQRVGFRPGLLRAGPAQVAFYWPWMLALPLFGALGAHLSRRAGGAVWTRVTAALAPVLWLFLLTILVEPLELASKGPSQLIYFGYGMAEYVAIPGLILLMGAAPFLCQSRARETQRSR
jgi:hypothetical protein